MAAAGQSGCGAEAINEGSSQPACGSGSGGGGNTASPPSQSSNSNSPPQPTTGANTGNSQSGSSPCGDAVNESNPQPCGNSGGPSTNPSSQATNGQTGSSQQAAINGASAAQIARQQAEGELAQAINQTVAQTLSQLFSGVPSADGFDGDSGSGEPVGSEAPSNDVVAYNAPPSADQGTSPPSSPDQGSAAPPSPDQGTASPPSPDQGSAAPPSPDQGTASPPSPDQGSAAPPSSDQGTASPPTSDAEHSNNAQQFGELSVNPDDANLRNYGTADAGYLRMLQDIGQAPRDDPNIPPAPDSAPTSLSVEGLQTLVYQNTQIVRQQMAAEWRRHVEQVDGGPGAISIFPETIIFPFFGETAGEAASVASDASGMANALINGDQREAAKIALAASVNYAVVNPFAETLATRASPSVAWGVQYTASQAGGVVTDAAVNGVLPTTPETTSPPYP